MSNTEFENSTKSKIQRVTKHKRCNIAENQNTKTEKEKRKKTERNEKLSRLGLVSGSSCAPPVLLCLTLSRQSNQHDTPEFLF